MSVVVKKIVEKSVVLKIKYINNTAIINVQSLTLLTISALIADLFACIRVYQKLINKYEQSPTPSQPKKITPKLSDKIRINIKNVKSDRYAINFGRCGS